MQHSITSGRGTARPPFDLPQPSLRHSLLGADAGVITRRDTSRAPISPSSLQAAEQQDSHAVLGDQDADADLTARKSKIRPRWSKGQGAWSTPNGKDIGPAGGDGGGGGEEAGVGPAMATLLQDADGTDDAHREDDIMAELGQAGGLEEGGKNEEPAPIVSFQRT